MDFSLTPEEKELQQRVRQLAEEQITPIAAAVGESSRVSPEIRNTRGKKKTLVPRQRNHKPGS